jgi:hypothetical protein
MHQARYGSTAATATAGTTVEARTASTAATATTGLHNDGSADHVRRCNPRTRRQETDGLLNLIHERIDVGSDLGLNCFRVRAVLVHFLDQHFYECACDVSHCVLL